MRARTPAGLAAAVCAVLLAGCGHGRAQSAPAPVGTARACGDAVVTPGVTRQVCVGIGRTLRLAQAAGEQPATERGAALLAVAPGVYRGARAGSAELSGFRHACPAAKPGSFTCHAIAGWTVTVRVGGAPS